MAEGPKVKTNELQNIRGQGGVRRGERLRERSQHATDLKEGSRAESISKSEYKNNQKLERKRAKERGAREGEDRRTWGQKVTLFHGLYQMRLERYNIKYNI